jgi:hypothetical protein
MKLGQRACAEAEYEETVDEPPYASAVAYLVKARYVNATGALRWLNGRCASPQSIVKELKIGNQHLHPTTSLIQIIQ